MYILPEANCAVVARGGVALCVCARYSRVFIDIYVGVVLEV